MKCFIISWNRLTSLRNMCDFLDSTGVQPIIVENCSTYPPLLEWLKNCPYMVHRMERNFGHLALWKSGLINQYHDRYYCVSDPDLDLSGIPHDYIQVLLNGLIHNPDVTKAGLSLRIDDLPENNYTKEVIAWETKFWKTKQDALGFYKSDIDTTFALYDIDRNFGKLPPEDNKFYWAVRSPEEYSVRHIPWYDTKEIIEQDEEKKYFYHHSHGYWSEKIKELL